VVLVTSLSSVDQQLTVRVSQYTWG